MDVMSDSCSVKPAKRWFGSESIADDVMRGFVKDAPGKPVFMNFDCKNEIGRIKSACMVSGMLQVVADLDIAEFDGSVIVPAYRVNNILEVSDSSYLVSDADLLCFALTDCPVEHGLKTYII